MERAPSDFRLMLVTAPRGELGKMPPIPPIGLALLAAKAREYGAAVTQDDLDVKLIHHRDLMAELTARTAHIDGRALPRIAAAIHEDPALCRLMERIAALTDFSGHDLIGFSIAEEANAAGILLSAFVAAETGTPIVVGGKSSLVSELLLAECPHVTYVILGEGEVPLVALLDGLAGKRPLAEVPSLVFRDESGAVCCNEQWLFDIAEVPCPDFDGLPLDHYRSFPVTDREHLNPLGLLVLPYKISYGCPFRCAFCSRSSKTEGERLCIRPAATVVAELESLSRRYGTRHFMFLDEAVNLNARELHRMTEGMAAAGLDLMWGDTARVAPMTPETLTLMAQAGCIYLNWGVESGSDKILRAMQKKCTVEQAETALRAAHAAGMMNHINIIVGFPGESDEDFQETVDFVVREAEAIDAISVVPFKLRNSAVLNEPERFGVKLEGPVDSSVGQSGDWARYTERSTPLTYEELKTRNLEREARLRAACSEKEVLLTGLSNIYAKYGLFEQGRDKREVAHLAAAVGGAGRTLRLFLGGNALTAGERRHTIPPRPLDDLLRQLAFGRRELHFANLVLWGGEPTRRSDLFRLLRAARKLGYRRITLETDARLLAYEEKMARIRRAGVSGLVLPVYGAGAAEHDSVLGFPGAFTRSFGALERWRDRGGAAAARPIVIPGSGVDGSALRDFCRRIDRAIRPVAFRGE